MTFGEAITSLLFELEARGIRLRTPDGVRLLADPVAALTSELRAAITPHRPAILALVQRAQLAGATWPLDVITPEEAQLPNDWTAPVIAATPSSGAAA